MKTRLSDTARDPVLSGSIQDAVELSYRRYVPVTQPMRCFSEALGLFENLTDEVARENGNDNRGALHATRRHSAVF